MKPSVSVIPAIAISFLALSHTLFAPPIRIRIPPEAIHVPPRILPHIEVSPLRPHVSELPHVTAHSGESLTTKVISAIPDIIETGIDVYLKQFQAAPTQQEKRQHLDESFRILRIWHEDITQRRTRLDPTDLKAVLAFNIDAAKYHDALHSAQRAFASLLPAVEKMPD